jgi:VIT1/CCC1 family predicted Fe2+/Mn2+ transporter
MASSELLVMRALRVKGRVNPEGLAAATGLSEDEAGTIASKLVADGEAGDSAWLLKPLIDSYHTVWFELHEDLIGLAGHTREAEAASGRAE